VAEQPELSEERDEEGRRPAEHHDSDRTFDRSKDSPVVRQQHVAVADRRVGHGGKIERFLEMAEGAEAEINGGVEPDLDRMDEDQADARTEQQRERQQPHLAHDSRMRPQQPRQRSEADQMDQDDRQYHQGCKDELDCEHFALPCRCNSWHFAPPHPYAESRVDRVRRLTLD